MTTPAFTLQKAIYLWLSDDASLTAMLSDQGLRDAPTPAARFPYVTFGRASGFDWSSATERGQEIFLTFHIWSNSRGRQETAAIMQQIDERLRSFDPQMAELRLVLLDCDLQEIRHDSEAALYRGTSRYRALVEEVEAA
ncbi:DUF3168 domain-containing protein [Notoacmeibacter sp. MSK16QG-6]|uniref:DUF3168 domain-containing protein n=1 Tax=Notoacmeibacter sp. MSK16QG-6 TaxID=2957982 RepID=UPI0020A0AC81|nr:DUF3168 domain-containing protein [Notoacmeibacter sp. MSK16QG-6]MCP1198132.1 DUF3168 domain-containing protein [Notoacmeibacter sp. MSK16QG-6]